MLTLLNECRFWTTNNEIIRIEDNDFGAFRYYTKKDFNYVQNVESQAKKEYHEQRDGQFIVNNDKPTRLKDNLRKLEEHLKLYRAIKAEWRDSCLLQILLCNGILIHICVNIFTGDVLKMAFDKYFIGKLATDVITDAIFSRQHILLAYNTNQLTVVYLQKPNSRKNKPEKISNMEPKIFHVLIPGNTDKKIDRKLVVNSSFDLIIVWTKSSQNEIFPWKPTIEDQNHANMHVFKLRAEKLEPIGYFWTENEPMYICFLRSSEGQILTVEQKISRKGEITAEICFYTIGKGKLQKVLIKSIAIRAQISCCSLSGDQEKLLLGTIDRFICIYNLARQTTKFAKRIDIIPTKCSWHPDSSIIMLANEKSEFQCFDFSLNLITNQITNKDYKATNIMNLSSYFLIRPNLLNIAFNLKSDLNTQCGKYSPTDCFLLLLYENGPIGCLRFFATTGLRDDIYNSGLTPDILCFKYLAINQLEKSVNILLSTNWETNGSMCILSLQKITNHVITGNGNDIDHHKLLMRALQSFSNTLNEGTREEYSDSVIDLKRKFFFYLLRNQFYLEAFDLAREVEDYDLFMDLFNCTKTNQDLLNFSEECYHQAKLILNQDDNDNDDGETTSSSSESSCSDLMKTTQFSNKSNMPSTSAQYLTVKRYQKSRGLDDLSSFKYKPNNSTKKASVSNLKNYVPPLPYLRSPVVNAENIKINSPNSDNQENILTNKQNDKIDNNLEQFKFNLKSELQDLNGDNEISAIYLSSTHRRTSQFRPVVPQKNTRMQNNGETSTFSYRNNSQLGIISTSFNESEEEIDQTLGIPEVCSSSEPYTFKSSTNTNHSTLINTAAQSNIQSLSKINLETNSIRNAIPLLPKKICEKITETPYTTKYFQYPSEFDSIKTPLENIPIKSTPARDPSALNIYNFENNFKQRKPSASILSNSSSNGSSIQGSVKDITQNGKITLNKRDSGERNKVKFSDTIHVAIVPEIPRKEKPVERRNCNGFLDPKKELADSLPLCHPDDDYLKDFTPLTVLDAQATNLINNNINDNEPRTEQNTASNNINNKNNVENNNDENSNRNDTKSVSTIKVVHFGVV